MRGYLLRRLSLVLGLLLAPWLVAQAGTVHGTVKNGTTGKPGAGVEVILIQLQGGMQPVSNSKTDAQGQFTFDNPSLGAQPMLIRAVYRGVNFHQPVPPGKSEVEVEVFEPTQDASTVTIPTHIVILQPNGSNLIVGEEYSVRNDSNPKKAYFRADGNFEFAVPDKAQLQQAAAWGPSGMPVVQATIDKTKNHYAIAYAFRPGESGVRYSYELPYAGNAATLKFPTMYPGAKLLVLAAPTMQISGEGLEPGGQEQGMNIYGRESLPANSVFSVNVSGTAPPPKARCGRRFAVAGAARRGGRGAGDRAADSGAAGCVEVAADRGLLGTVCAGSDFTGAKTSGGCGRRRTLRGCESAGEIREERRSKLGGDCAVFS